MHRNVYDHDASEAHYREHISNIAYRFNFEVIYEKDDLNGLVRVLKVENGEATILSSAEIHPRNALCYHAWMKLQEEYDFTGIWRDEDGWNARWRKYEERKAEKRDF